MTSERFEKWLARYKSAWETRDPDAAVLLFTSDATYRVTPFREPELHAKGIRDYWTRVTADQRNVRFQSDMLAISGDRGVCHWNCQFDLESDGSQLEIDGIFVFDLGPDDQCHTFREWWHEHVTEPERS
jgi:nuclear transport factor 2 (NTF2) superfamily protein